MAAVARLSAYPFARQFKVATGQPPHQYVIARRVERAQQLLQHDRDLSLAEIAAGPRFSGQSPSLHHFNRLVRVTPARVPPHARKPSRPADPPSPLTRP